MTTLRLAPWLVAAAFALAPVHAQGIGSQLPSVELEGYSQTSARSLEDYQGRAVLIEFFAYW